MLVVVSPWTLLLRDRAGILVLVRRFSAIQSLCSWRIALVNGCLLNHGGLVMQLRGGGLLLHSL